LIAAAADRPVSELRDYNPSLLRTVAPAGFTLHVPKGTLAHVEAVLHAVPASKRDAWRVHRVESDDNFTTLAKRYGTTPGSVSSVNQDTLPEAGSWAVIPVAYPGDVVASSVQGISKSRRANSNVTASSRKGLPVRAALRKPLKMPTASAKNPVKATASARRPTRIG